MSATININNTDIDLGDILAEVKGEQANLASTGRANPDNTAESIDESKKESRYAKDKRKRLDVLYREDNLQIDDAQIEAALQKIGVTFGEPTTQQTNPAPAPMNESKSIDAMSDLGINESINIDSSLSTLNSTRATKRPLTRKAATKSRKAKSTPATGVDAVLSGVLGQPETGNQKLNIEHEVEPDEENRFKKVLAIQRYTKSPFFATYLKEQGVNLTDSKMNSMSMEELDKVLTKVRIFCKNKPMGSAMADLALFRATDLVEKVATYRAGVNMIGYTNDLQNDPGFLEAWELIKLEYLSFANMSPEVRFAWGLIGNAADRYKKNQEAMAQQIQQMQQQAATAPPPDDLMTPTPFGFNK